LIHGISGAFIGIMPPFSTIVTTDPGTVRTLALVIVALITPLLIIGSEA